ncbi:MAG TPA: MFS transporter [Ruminococcus sp.]|nr:MFS transporter [Ruminococcus sp.]
MKNFLYIWLGEFISSVGTGMTSFALSVYVFQTYGSASAVSLVTLLAYLPTILLSPVGGLLADRFNRRLMMVCGDLFSAFGLVFILLNMQFGSLKLWMICVGVTISSIFSSLLNPAYKATITDLLTEEEYAKASGMVQIASSAQYLISPFLAGILLGFSDIRLILMIDICTIFVTVFTILMVNRHIKEKPRKEEDFHPLKELREGWNSVAGHAGIRTLVILMAFACFTVGFLQTLMSPMVLSFASSKSLGYLESISAVGMLIGSIIIGVMSIKRNYCRVLFIGLALNGIAMAAIGLTCNMVFIMCSGILFFITLPFVNVSADTMARLNIPNEVQGRAWGVIGILSQLGYVLAYGLSGVLADYVFCPLLEENGILAGSLGKIFGTGQGRGIGLMLSICGLLIIVVLLRLMRSKPLREMDVIEPETAVVSEHS